MKAQDTSRVTFNAWPDDLIFAIELRKKNMKKRGISVSKERLVIDALSKEFETELHAVKTAKEMYDSQSLDITDYGVEE